MTRTLALRLSVWLNRQDQPQSGPIRLTQGRVYVLPTRSGLLLAVTLLLMLGGCLNYNLGLGYVLTFLLAGVALVSMLHTFRNLAHLEFQAGRAEPVFAGTTAVFPVQVRNSAALVRRSIGVGVADSTGLGTASEHLAPNWRDLAPRQTVAAEVRLEASRRGRLRLPRLRVQTTFPLGLFTAWSNLHLDMSCLVYPRPEAGEVPLPPPQPGDAQGGNQGRGQDDFAGLRRYQPGDSPRHVAWKAVARGRDVVTKHFTGAGTGELWLCWSQLPSDLRLEAKLSRLTRWVLEAERAGMAFGLELPGTRLPPAAGHHHRHACLSALALYQGEH